MGKIIILDENTANKIAAGEVIERPASIVKEMVENSIDAGATVISIEIKNGGTSYIKITDNGTGIAEDDTLLCFERHATGKISCGDDLFNIKTMGFRGEALASIAAVSEVTLITGTEDCTTGTEITITGGKLISHKKTAKRRGTVFIVKNLFYNTPARFKFLKKDGTEASYISDIVSRIALSHPEISFRLSGISGGKDIFHTPGNGDLKSAIYNIYGRNTAAGMISVSYELDGIKVDGCVGKGEIAKANRSGQSVFINGRYIKNRTVSAAADEAYRSHVMKNKFPVFVLNLNMDSGLFDVNVHPSKLEVRFQNEKDVFSAVYHAILNALNSKSEYAKPFPKTDTLPEKVSDTPPAKTSAPYKKNGGAHESEQIRIYNHSILNEIAAKPAAKAVREDTRLHEEKPDDLFPPVKPQAAEVINIKSSTEESPNVETASVTRPPDRPPLDEIKSGEYIGCVFSTYLIFQNGSEIFVIDQHAAHERVNYELLLRNHRNSETATQQLLIPIVPDIGKIASSVLSENLSFFGEIGFDIEPFGDGTFIIRGIPFNVEYSEAENLVNEIIEQQTNGNPKPENVKNKAFYSIACKMSVKANMKLTANEIKALIEDLSAAADPFHCPHGRPIIMKLNKADFEKMFKRIQ